MKNTILHIGRHPYYCAAENAVSTLVHKESDYSHVFVELCPPKEPDRFYLFSEGEIDRRVDLHVVYTGERLHFEHVQAAILYDLDEEDIAGKVEHDGRTICWEIDRKLKKPTIKAGGDDPVYPLINVDRLSTITGKVQKTTIGMLYDPNVPGFNEDLIRLVAESLDSTHRLLVTRPDCLYKGSGISDILKDKFKCEVVSRPFTIGIDSTLESLCSIVVSDYSANPGTYGYMCATAMAMGKLLICDKAGEYAKYSKDRVSAIHFDDWKAIPKYIAWAENNKLKVDKLRSNAMTHSDVHDVDPNIHKLRSYIYG